MLTIRMQIQAIADRLAGLPGPDLPLEDFHQPWRAVYQAILEAPPEAMHGALLEALADRTDGELLVRAIYDAVPGERPKFPSLSEIAPSLPPIRWLWPGWIPRGMISLLGSVPGAGKSYLALDLAHRVLEGRPFPDGRDASSPDGAAGRDANGPDEPPRSCPHDRDASSPPGRDASSPDGSAGWTTEQPPAVIYVDAEDVPQIINQRAELWDLDTSRLYLMQPRNGDLIDLSQMEDRDHLIEMTHCLEPALIIVDSLSCISSKGENNVEDVREVLSFLNALALDAQCGLLLIHHLRKRGILTFSNALTVDDFRGSSHIIAIARSVLGLSIIQTGPEPDRNGPRRLEIIKTNLARYPAPLGVEFLSLHPTGVLLKYGPAPRPYRPPTKLDQCKSWLEERLAQAAEPLRPADLLPEAEEAGFCRTTLYNARQELGDRIRDTKGRKHRGNRWELAR